MKLFKSIEDKTSLVPFVTWYDVLGLIAGVLIATAIFALAGADDHSGDIINYAPPDAPRGAQYIVVAPDGARYEPRWHAMLDANDYRNLDYILAGRQGNNGNIFIFGN